MSTAREGTGVHRVFAGLGRLAVRRPWWTIGAWLLATVAVAALVVTFGRPVDDDTTLPGSSAQYGRDLLKQHFPGGDGANGLVIVRSPDGPLDPAELARAADRIATAGHVTSVTPPSVEAGSLTPDRTTGYLSVQFDVGSRDLGREVIADVLAAAESSLDAEVLPGGALARAEVDTRRSEALGLGVALVVLIVAFGGLVAAGLPLLTAFVTLLCGLGLIGLAGHLTAVPAVATTIATMIGLGVGIDYALFMISRYRALLARSPGDGEGGTAAVGRPEAIVATVASSGSAVAFAGATVVVALAGLAVSGVPLLATLGWSAGLIVLVAVGSAVTLLPALLAVLGPRIDAFPVGRRRPGRGTEPDRRAATGRGSLWGALADRVTARPWPYALASVMLLLVVAAPVTDMSLGQTDAGDEPPGTTARVGYDTLAAAFGAGVNGPITVVAELSPPAGPGTRAAPAGQVPSTRPGDTAAEPGQAGGPAPEDTRVADLVAAAGAVDGVRRVHPARVSADGRAVSVRIVARTGPGDPATAATVAGLERIGVLGARVHVTGPTAVKAALADRVGARMPYVIGLVVVLAALLVLIAFRAPVVAVKAAVMNLFSVAAAYGVLTAVFAWGWGVSLLGLDGPVPIESYVPMLLFALLFGLSMDYEVFLLTAVRESWEASGDDRGSVRDGLAGTGVVISSAALIMVCVFAGFVLSPAPAVKMTGLGLAVAVAIDATVIRGVLVPATMALMGRANWWPARPRSHRDVDEVAAGQDPA